MYLNYVCWMTELSLCYKVKQEAKRCWLAAGKQLWQSLGHHLENEKQSRDTVFQLFQSLRVFPTIEYSKAGKSKFFILKQHRRDFQWYFGGIFSGSQIPFVSLTPLPLSPLSNTSSYMIHATSFKILSEWMNTDLRWSVEVVAKTYWCKN